MPRPRRSFTPEYRVEAAHRVIDRNRRVAEVARELDLHENLLHKWVADERRRMAAAGGGGGPDPGGGEPLSADERAELVRLRAQPGSSGAVEHRRQIDDHGDEPPVAMAGV